MSRSHIHFAVQPSHVRTNAWARVLLRLDLHAALAAGHAFGLSSNGVLLTEGPLPVALVCRVEEEQLPEEWTRKVRLTAWAAHSTQQSVGAGAAASGGGVDAVAAIGLAAVDTAKEFDGGPS